MGANEEARVHISGSPLCGPQTVKQAVLDVMQVLPKGVELHTHAFIERYPPQRGSGFPGAVFAYQFMTTEGLNIATWIPSLEMPVQLQDGRGRRYDATTHAHGSENISWVWRELAEQDADSANTRARSASREQ